MKAAKRYAAMHELDREGAAALDVQRAVRGRRARLRCHRLAVKLPLYEKVCAGLRDGHRWLRALTHPIHSPRLTHAPPP